jgi:hypothetical protein
MKPDCCWTVADSQLLTAAVLRETQAVYLQMQIMNLLQKILTQSKIFQSFKIFSDMS